MYSASADTTQTQIVNGQKVPTWKAHLVANDWLPSINAVIGPAQLMNIRLSYSRTILRPSMREITPYASYDFENDYNLYGNIDLKSTVCKNFDLRWEWFRRPGEIISIGGYYKHFTNPIELVLNPIQNDLARPYNSPYGYALGLEFEARTSLDLINEKLRNFRLGFNGALIRSRMRITNVEENQWNSLSDKTGYSKETNYFGQSPWVINANLSYENGDRGTSVGAYFNVAGPYVTLVQMPPDPPILQAPFPQLDFIASQKFFKRFTYKAAVSNVLNASSKQYKVFKGKEFLCQKNTKGVTVSMGLSMTL